MDTPGDYNATEEAQEISPFLASGKAFSLDENFAAEGLPIATRKDGKRGLDFGASSRDFYATRRWQQAGLSDHDLVGYEIPVATPVDTCYICLLEDDFLQLARKPMHFFKSIGRPLSLARHVNNKVWIRSGLYCLTLLNMHLLEIILAQVHAALQVGHPNLEQHITKLRTHMNLCCMRQLRRVHRRLVEFIRHAHQDDLQRVLRKNMQMLQAKIPQLIGNINANAEELATILQDAIAEKERHCIQEYRTAWKTSLQDSSIKQSQWIRRRASAVRTEVALADAESRHLWLAKATAICPQHQIQEAEQQWAEIWAKRPVTDACVAISKMPF